MILNIDPHLRMGRKDEALLQEKFLDGIEKAEQEVARIKTWLCLTGFSNISLGAQSENFWISVDFHFSIIDGIQ